MTGLAQVTNTISGNSLLPAIDGAGDRIAFRSDAPLGSNSGVNLEIFLWDASTGFTQITNATSGNSESPAINAAGNRIAFHSDADLLGTNGDENNELFLASCPPLTVVEIPAVSPLGLGALIVLLGFAAAWTFRRPDGDFSERGAVDPGSGLTLPRISACRNVGAREETRSQPRRARPG